MPDIPCHTVSPVAPFLIKLQCCTVLQQSKVPFVLAVGPRQSYGCTAPCGVVLCCSVVWCNPVGIAVLENAEVRNAGLGALVLCGPFGISLNWAVGCGGMLTLPRKEHERVLFMGLGIVYPRALLVGATSG